MIKKIAGIFNISVNRLKEITEIPIISLAFVSDQTVRSD